MTKNTENFHDLVEREQTKLYKKTINKGMHHINTIKLW